MSKRDALLWTANIEILYGLYHPAKDLGEILSSKKTQTIRGPKGSVPGTLRRPSDEEMDNYFKKASILEGYTDYHRKNTHWCGIFQIYLLRHVGVACHWDREIIDDSGGKDLEITKGLEAQKDLAVGDIVKVKHQQHHFMVIDPVEKGFIRSLEGNAGGVGLDKNGNEKKPLLAANWMGNMTHNIVQEIQYRYRVIG